jgi:hypothetical protein
MGLTWIIQPIPDNEQQRENTAYEYTYRAEPLNDTNLPDTVLCTAITNMGSYQMEEYAETLIDELSLRNQAYTERDEEIISNAAEWLQYWAASDKELIAWH